MEKKLRIFDLDTVRPNTHENNALPADTGFEIGAGEHKGAIKSIVWTQDPNILVTTADDKVIRWWDLQTRSVVKEERVQGEIGSCEFTNVKGEASDIGGTYPVLTIAAGKSVYFFGGSDARSHLKTINLPYEVVSAALHPVQRKLVTGGKHDTWAKVYDYDTEQEIGTSASRLLDNTNTSQMSIKAIMAPFGASASLQMESYTRQVARTAQSRCGRIVRVHMDYGVLIGIRLGVLYHFWSLESCTLLHESEMDVF